MDIPILSIIGIGKKGIKKELRHRKSTKVAEMNSFYGTLLEIFSIVLKYLTEAV